MDYQNIYPIFRKHSYISIDSRKIEKDGIYWAIKGEKFDGNTFAEEALAKGAAYCVVDNAELVKNERYLLVDDSLIALQKLAAYHRTQLNIPIIAITGSNGKTTTKELMYKVLSKKYNAFATPGNFNNHIGLPLSLLMLKAEHEIAIIELGANHIGENAFLCEICQPDYGLITNIGKDHLEGFGSVEGVLKANLELFDYLKLHSGVAFINLDDPYISHHTQGLKTRTYAIHKDADFKAEIKQRFPQLCITITNEDQNSIDINSHFFGSMNAYNLLAATAAGTTFEVSPQNIKSALESYVPENNRSQIIKKGSNTIILDAYNANPSSMHSVIEDFADFPSKNKVVLLGDMFELGAISPSEHRQVLEKVNEADFWVAAFAGKDFYALKDDFKGFFFEKTEDLIHWLRGENYNNTIFLIKGSRGMKMELTIDAIHE